MKIRPYLKKLSLALVASASVLTISAAEKGAGPYNVLFIAIDDMRTELNCYGAEHIKSPHIDRLAAEGIRFSNAYVQQAICMASRASLMTGLRPEKRGIYTGEPVGKLTPDIVTMNKLFKQNGYNVSSMGKIYHFSSDTKEQFGEDFARPKKAAWFGRGYVTEESKVMMGANPDASRGPAFEMGDVEDEAYPDGANAALAVEKLKELKEAGKPFFMAFGLIKPHLPFNAPKKYWDLYPENEVGLSDIKERPENSHKYTMRVKGELGNYLGMPELFTDVDEDTARTLRRAYFACVSYVDAQVGKVLDQLEALDLRDNTIIVLWGDHGFKLGDYDGWCKWTNMDIDTRVPLIISAPQGVEGAVCDRMVETLDLYPTLAELCGLEKPAHLEGKSLVPLLKDPALVSEDYRYAYTVWPDSRWNYDRTVLGYSVKDQRYNYVEWVKLSTREVVAKELYDHQVDPKETKNVVDAPEYAVAIATLAEQCAILKDHTDHDHAFKKLR